MQENSLYIIIFLLLVTIAVLAYVTYENNKKIKQMQIELIESRSAKRVEAPRPLMFDRNINSAYSPTEVKNYYRSATIPERRWQKVGVLTAGDKTMNLLAQPSTYNEDIWRYRAEDKDGFIIELGELELLRTNSVIPSIPGKVSAGAWTVQIYSQETRYL